MPRNLLKALERQATGKNVLLLFALLIICNVLVMPAVYPRSETLDLQSSYTPDRVYELLAALGEQGRPYYAVIELTLDLVYPALSALFVGLFTVYAFRRIFPLHSIWQNLPLVAPIVMGADYLENICVLTMLFLYPQRIDAVAQLANLFTVTKMALSYVELVLMAIGLIGLLLVLSLRRRQKG